jgi:hypothetical protein
MSVQVLEGYAYAETPYEGASVVCIDTPGGVVRPHGVGTAQSGGHRTGARRGVFLGGTAAVDLLLWGASRDHRRPHGEQPARDRVVEKVRERMVGFFSIEALCLEAARFMFDERTGCLPSTTPASLASPRFLAHGCITTLLDTSSKLGPDRIHSREGIGGGRCDGDSQSWAGAAG